MKLGLEYRRCN